MRIQHVNPEEKIAHVALSMETDPNSWKGWAALHLKAVDGNAEDFQDVVIMAARPMIESYFEKIEGSTYFCNQKDIFIICKNVSRSVLKEVLMELQDLAFGDNGLPCEYGMYCDLGRDGPEFADAVFQDIERPFLQTDSGIDRLIGEGIELKRHKINDGRRSHRTVKVLLVDDDPVTRWMIGNTLKEECDITAVDTAGKVFASYEHCKPDIVLLDIGLPDNNGDEVLSWIMRTDPSANVVMLSGKDSVDNIASCIEHGARGFIAKPFVKENLLHYIHKYG